MNLRSSESCSCSLILVLLEALVLTALRTEVEKRGHVRSGNEPGTTRFPNTVDYGISLVQCAQLQSGGSQEIFTFHRSNRLLISGTDHGFLPRASASQNMAALIARPELGGSASGADAAHYMEWIRASQGRAPARANYSYEAPIVETPLLGCIAVRTHERLKWDSLKFELTGGSERATAMLKPQFRAPWGN